MGCRVLLALPVLHRAKLLASNQSILALGRSPKRGEGGRVDYNIKCNTKNMDIILTFV